MTPQEAFELIEQVVVKYHGTRADHVLLAQALEVVKPALVPESPKE